MKLKDFFSILCFGILVRISRGKLKFHKEDKSNVDILKYFFDGELFNVKLLHLTIIPLNFAEVNPSAFTDLLINLNHNSRSRLNVMDNVTMANKTTREDFLILHVGNEIGPLLNVLDSIDKKARYGFIRVLIWYEGIELKKTKSIIEIKTGNINVNEVIVLYPISNINNTTGKKDLTERVKITFKNALLAKKNLVVNSKVGYETNKTEIKKTLIQAKKQLKVFSKQLELVPLQVLLFQRPMSVEKKVLVNNKIKYTGIDIKFLKVIQEILNVTYSLTEGNIQDYGNVNENGSLAKAYQVIRDKQIDLSINRFPVDVSKSGVVAIPYDRERFCFIVRKSRLQVRPWSLFISFTGCMWVIMLGIYISVYIFFLIVKEPQWKSITFLQSIVSPPHLRVARDSHRVFWGSWLLYIVMVTNIFTSIFVTQLLPKKNMSRYKSIKTLIKLNFTLLSETGRFVITHPELRNETIIPYYGRPQDIDEKTALLTSELTRIKLKYMFAFEFEVVDDCLKKKFVGPLMSTSNAMFTKTGVAVSRILSAGLVIFWVNSYLNTELVLAGNKKRDPEDRKYNEPIKLKEIEFIFKYITFGQLAAVLAFICELLYFKMTKVLKSKVGKPSSKKICIYPYNY